MRAQVSGGLFNIDMKTHDNTTAQLLANEIARLGAQARVIVGSFDDATVRAFREFAPGVSTLASLVEVKEKRKGGPPHGSSKHAHTAQRPLTDCAREWRDGATSVRASLSCSGRTAPASTSPSPIITRFPSGSRATWKATIGRPTH